MKASISAKLEQVVARHEEVAALLADPDTIGDQDRFRALSMEYAQNEPVVRQFAAWQDAESARTDALEMVNDGDAELSALARHQIGQPPRPGAQAQVDACASSPSFLTDGWPL